MQGKRDKWMGCLCLYVHVCVYVYSLKYNYLDDRPLDDVYRCLGGGCGKWKVAAVAYWFALSLFLTQSFTLLVPRPFSLSLSLSLTPTLSFSFTLWDRDFAPHKLDEISACNTWFSDMSSVFVSDNGAFSQSQPPKAPEPARPKRPRPSLAVSGFILLVTTL